MDQSATRHQLPISDFSETRSWVRLKISKGVDLGRARFPPVPAHMLLLDIMSDFTVILADEHPVVLFLFNQECTLHMQYIVRIPFA